MCEVKQRKENVNGTRQYKNIYCVCVCIHPSLLVCCLSTLFLCRVWSYLSGLSQLTLLTVRVCLQNWYL
uniref:Uncharacterized protein n=1 Tax=Octopus bimaculoides TaxID=37653 RepID=A0A0L8FPA0_OCTBM